MDDHSNSTNQGKRDKARGDNAANELVRQQHQITPKRLPIQLAFAGVTITKLIGYFLDPRRLGGGSDYIQENLKAHAGEIAPRKLQNLATHGEEAAHRIGQIMLDYCAA